MADDMTEDKMPFNIVGEDIEKKAEEQAELEAEWREKNLPAEKLLFHWRYASRKIQLYERRLRSLAAFNVGPAVQAGVRSRLEWMQDNRLYEQPDGVLELSIDPEGDVAMRMLPVTPAPAFDEGSLSWEGDELAGCALEGTLWVLREQRAHVVPADIRHAADTFTRDLVTTLGATMDETPVTRGMLDGAEIFVISDEHGIVPCEGHDGTMTGKLSSCFDKLWSAR